VSNVAYIKNNFILNGPSIQLKHGVIKEASKNIILTSGTTRFLRNVEGKILSILSGGSGSHNYWHWLFDVIPRILLFEKCYSLNQINKILVPAIKKKFQYQTLNILGIKIKHCINAMMFRHIKVRELYVTTHPNPSSKKVPYWIILLLKKKFLKKKLLKKNYNKFKKIYIDRSDSDSNVKDFRKIVNENLVKVFLIFKGFKIVRLSDYDFIEQVSIFYNAYCVIGLHGAGFANIIFCKKNALVMEVKSNTTNNIIKNLAISNKLRYVNISLKPIDKPIGSQFGIVYLPLIKLNYFLRQYDI
jgi:capsular polysaccharide biosynthesis protein